MKNLNKVSLTYLMWALFIIVVPLLLIVFYAFTIKTNDVTTFSFSLNNFHRFISESLFLKVLFDSLKIALITTILSLLLSYPLAYIIAKKKEGVQAILILILTFPTWINMLVRTYAWIGIFQTNGVISNIFAIFGIENFSLMYSDFAVLVGMVYNFMPFMVLQIYNSINKIDPLLLEAANDLGASKLISFLKVILPLSVPGIISGITLVFLPAVSSFVIPKFLGGSQYVLIGNLIENEFITTGEWHFGSAISMLMTIVILISMYVVKKVDKGQSYETN